MKSVKVSIVSLLTSITAGPVPFEISQYRVSVTRLYRDELVGVCMDMCKCLWASLV
jgi:hypothetical protein